MCSIMGYCDCCAAFSDFEEGQELVLWGGNANNGANCGLAYANSNNDWSNSNANIGSRHTYLS